MAGSAALAVLADDLRAVRAASQRPGIEQLLIGRQNAPVLAVALLLWPLIPVELTPPADADEIDVEIEMAQGTNIAVVRNYVDELEARVREALPPGQVETISTEVRGGDAEVELTLVRQDQRSMPSAWAMPFWVLKDLSPPPASPQPRVSTHTLTHISSWGRRKAPLVGAGT